MKTSEALNTVAINNGYKNWDHFKEIETEVENPQQYWELKSEYLEQALTLLSENCTEIAKQLQEKKSDYVSLEHQYKLQQTKYFTAYREQVMNQIAQLEAVKMLQKMMASGHTHRQKEMFMEQASGVIDVQIRKLKDDYKTGSWRFGQGFGDDDLPF